MHTINGMTFVTDTDVRFFARVAVEGTTRVFHLIPDGESILHLCEWRDGRYACPVELSPASPLAGSRVGDSGYRLPGTKHSAAGLAVQTLPDGSRVLQGMWGSRPPDVKDGAFYLTFRAFHEIRLPPAPWAGLMQRLVEIERALGNQSEEAPNAALEKRVETLEERQKGAGEILKGE